MNERAEEILKEAEAILEKVIRQNHPIDVSSEYFEKIKRHPKRSSISWEDAIKAIQLAAEMGNEQKWENLKKYLWDAWTHNYTHAPKGSVEQFDEWFENCKSIMSIGLKMPLPKPTNNE